MRHFLRTFAVTLPFAVGLSLLLVFPGCGGEDAAEESPAVEKHGAQRKGGRGKRPGGGESVPVAVELARVGTVSAYHASTTTLAAESHAEIWARATGVVREVFHEEGDEVAAGDELLRLEDDDAVLRLRQAELGVEKARAEHRRRDAMREAGILSDEEFETAENTLALAQAERDRAGLELSWTRVRAPFTGKVTARLTDLGANVAVGTPLFAMMDTDPLLARIHIPATRMGSVAEAQEIELSVDGCSEPLRGVVHLVSPVVDPTSGTVKVTAEIHEAPESVRPGDFARVRIVTARHENTLIVPSIAVFEDRGESVVFVVEDGTAVRRTVTTGFVEGDDTELTEGVAEGERVVVKGQRKLKDGAPVEIPEAPESS